MSALVDGRLRADAAARAEAHVRACPPCAEAVEAERLVKARLCSLAGPAPSDDLLVRLHALGGPAGPLRPRDLPMPGMPQRPVAAPPRTRDDTRRPAGRRRGGRRARPLAVVLAGAFSLVGAGVAGAVLLSTVEAPALAPLAQFSWWQAPSGGQPGDPPGGTAPTGTTGR